MDSETPVTPQQQQQQQRHTDSLTLSAVPSDETQSAMQQHLAPPSPATAAKAGGEAASSSPAASLPAPSPAWESATNIEDDVRQQTAVSLAPLTAPAATTASIIAPGERAHSAPPNQTGVAGPPPSTSDPHGVAVVPILQSSERTEYSVRPPSVSGNDDQDSATARSAQHLRETSRAFFPTNLESTATAAAAAPAQAQQMGVEETWYPRGTHWQAAGEEEDEPSSTRSAGSGIFELEIASPELVPGTPQNIVMGDSLQTPRHGTEKASEQQVGRHEWTTSHGSAVASSMPSRSAMPLQGPWGRLQEVR